MGGLEDVLARLITDRSFREELTSDPAAALAGYDLSREDLEILAASLDEQVGGERAVEQRTSKSALLGMLGALAVDDDAASGLPTGKPRHNPSPVTTQQGTGDGSADAVRRWNVEGAWVQKTTGPSPAPGDGEYLIAEASHDAAAEGPHEDEIEIQSLHDVADDGGATGGAAQHQESDLAFVHERSGSEDEHGDLVAGEPAADGIGEHQAASDEDGA